MTDTEKLEKALDSADRMKKKVSEFAEMLDELSSTEEKKKLLWKQIYENALTDRENASMLFTDAWSRMSVGSSEHVALGSTLTKYLERMSKSNEQILRLAEIINKVQEQEAQIDSEDIFSKISKE
ncbi:MAG: hypothetical protein EBZ49_01685 [Proteobacteria bacterium]|nr:hypothetical protein [Pseudomonadota bacterium]